MGVRVVVMVFLGMLLEGCESAVYPPANVLDAEPIYFLRYNVHSSIALPRDGEYVEYSFGDWNYAALHHKFINDAVGALTVSFDSAFERRILQIDARSGLPVIRERRLAELDARFESDMKLHQADGVIVYADAGETYVKDSQHYSVANNCNHLTADTLRALGFRVDGVTFTNDFHLGEPQRIGETAKSAE
jgi:hypothetical protein